MNNNDDYIIKLINNRQLVMYMSKLRNAFYCNAKRN